MLAEGEQFVLQYLGEIRFVHHAHIRCHEHAVQKAGDDWCV